MLHLPYSFCYSRLAKLVYPLLFAWMGALLLAASPEPAQTYDIPLSRRHAAGHHEGPGCSYPGSGPAGCPGQEGNWNSFMRPITPGLTVPSPTVTYTGMVQLQARTNHSGTALYLVDGPCASLQPSAALTATPAGVTNKAGQFTLTLAGAEGEHCLLARHPHYLPARRPLPAPGDLGKIILPAGDVNQDDRIDILDLTLISKKYDKANRAADLNGDRHIDLIDLTLAAYNFSHKGPVEWPVPGLGSGNFSWPASGDISNGFYRYHPALDIASGFGEPILAADSGQVVVAEWDNFYGYHIVIDHGNGYQTLYAHLQRYYVDAGLNVSKGAQIGEMGSTGNSSGPHLHFEIIQENVRRNPYNFLP